MDVWSEEGVGTEVKVTFLAESCDDLQGPSTELKSLKLNNRKPPSVSLLGFDTNHPGVELFNSVLRFYLVSWWGFEIQPTHSELGEIVILNDDPTLVNLANGKLDTSRSFIILSSSRYNPRILAVASDYELIGGFCRIVHKPCGPARLASVLKMCLGPSSGPDLSRKWQGEADRSFSADNRLGSQVFRRHSEKVTDRRPTRPGMSPRSFTDDQTTSMSENSRRPSRDILKSAVPTVSVGSGGSLLESSVGTIDISRQQFRVLVVEDNSILRGLLYDFILFVLNCILHYFSP